MYTTCARKLCSRGYIVVSSWVLIKLTGDCGRSKARRAARRRPVQQQQQQQQQRQPATAGSDVCERYRYLREGICVELAYNRRADLLIRNPAAPLTRVPRAVFSARTQYLVAVSSAWPFPPFCSRGTLSLPGMRTLLKIRARSRPKFLPPSRLVPATFSKSGYVNSWRVD